jgi:putative membrane protein
LGSIAHTLQDAKKPVAAWSTSNDMSMDSVRHGADRFDVRATSDSHFGWLRTRMALERTQMAWIRTGLSLIAFGFTIYQVISNLPNPYRALHSQAARDLGLLMIGTGIIALLLGLLEYRSAEQYMWSPEFKPIAGWHDKRGHSHVFLVTLIVLVVGIVAFLTVVFRVS